jgi:hypothetical protein
VERLLRETLGASGNAPLTSSCLDAETLAAWADGGLSRESLELAQLHAVDCVRCQTLLGTLTRMQSAVPEPAVEQTSRKWLGWLVPLSAAAVGVIAVALWVSLPRESVVPLQQTAEKQIQEVEKTSPAQQPVAGTRETAAKADSQTATPKEEAFRRDGQRLEPDGARPQSTLAAAAQDAATPTAAGRASAINRSAAEAPAVEILSPDPAVRWRIIGARVQRSTNGGSNWSTVSIGFQGQLTAGSAPSASVCWLVGSGMVLLSTDGGTSWRRVAFSEPTNLSAVRATDARTASVTTTDGRTFSTNDGGLAWVRVAPQGF